MSPQQRIPQQHARDPSRYLGGGGIYGALERRFGSRFNRPVMVGERRRCHDHAASELTIDGVQLCSLETGVLSDKLLFSV